jgi:hypothetical protein
VASDTQTLFRAELVAAAARLHHRQRRRRRLLVACAAMTLASIIVTAASLAAGGWLNGSPAPKTVVSDFRSYPVQLGLHPEPGNAVLVARSGPYRMYATPDREGGYCVVTSKPWARPASLPDGGGCLTRSEAAVPFTFTFPGGKDLPHHGMLEVVGGRVRDRRVREVQFADPAHRLVTLPIQRSGFFIGSFAIPRFICRLTGYHLTARALDARHTTLHELRVTYDQCA